ncbi:MAG TPA: IS66 family transposase [Bacteroidales bacterium]|nr:IS66 family transposase [Bacteroidales bacterium]
MAKTIEISRSQIDNILQRLENNSIQKEDYTLLKLLVSTVISINEELIKKNISIKRLRKLFAIQSEKSKDILPASDKNKEKPSNGSKQGTKDQDKKKGKPKGHGRNGQVAYKNAEKKFVPHETYKPGCPCPECTKGKLYPVKDNGVFVHITAQEPFTATIYELQKLRCNLCGEIFTAQAPEHTNNSKYDESVAAMIAVLKYGAGFPFYRIDTLQDNFGVPLPDSTQWEILEDKAATPLLIYDVLTTLAAQGKVIHNDDTKMKVLSLIKENKQDPDRKRKGIFTSGFISRTDKFDIALYCTGRNTAGENLKEILEHRKKGIEIPIQMCDASNNNLQNEFYVLLANCLTHGRRKFADLIDVFSQECIYIIEALRDVYHNDSITKQERMTDHDRLAYHQQHSGPIMNKLYAWMTAQFAEKKVEPNSALGGAISYMIKHWDALTLFLRKAGAPLDNNIVERALKKVILHRKNSLFYKTEHGARIGDCFMSIIHTCELNRVNSLHYLIQVLKNRLAVVAAPELWLPWNYQSQLRDQQNQVGLKV